MSALSIATVGPSQIGKSVLIATLQHYFEHKKLPTKDPVACVTQGVEHKSMTIQDPERGSLVFDMLDTTGAAVSLNVMKEAVKKHKLFILCYSRDDCNSYNQMLQWLDWIKKNVAGSGKRVECIVVGLKEDLAGSNLPVTLIEGEDIVVHQQHRICALGSKMDDNTKLTFLNFAQALKTQLLLWHKSNVWSTSEKLGAAAAGGVVVGLVGWFAWPLLGGGAAAAATTTTTAAATGTTAAAATGTTAAAATGTTAAAATGTTAAATTTTAVSKSLLATKGAALKKFLFGLGAVISSKLASNNDKDEKSVDNKKK